MFEVNTLVQANNVTLMCSGRFDLQARKPFQTAIEEAKSHNPREIILNFSKVLSINSAGLGIILVAKQKMPDEYCKLKIAAPKGNVLDVLELANIGKSISITVL